MPAMSQATSLFLAPLDSNATPAMHDLVAVLRRLDLIGPRIGAASYAAGDGFSRHVIYAGCSPYLVMEPPADGSLQFCHVALHGPYPAPRLVTGPNTVRPRCPACRARFADWRERLAEWTQGGNHALCPACGTRSPVHRLDWRGHAVAGRVLIELRNVYPGEASPSDLLMHSLADRTGLVWRHAWAGYLID